MTTDTTASAAGGRVSHFSVAERAARGKAARAEVPRRVHGEWAPPPGRRDPVDLLEEQATHASAGARADPLRADAGLAVHVLSRRGVPDGRGPRRRAANGPSRAAVRRRAPVELRRLRRPRPAAGRSTSTTSTRRCRDRSSGTSSGWSRASRSPAATCGFDAKQRRGVNLAVTRAYREAMREFADDEHARSLVRAHRRRRDPRAVPERERAPSSRKRCEKNVAKARAKDSLRAFDKLTTMVDGEPRIISDPPLIVPIEELAAGAQRHEIEEFARGVLRSYRRTLAGRPPAPARALPLRARRAQGGRRRQRRHPRLDRADARPRRRRSAVPAAQGGRSPRCSSRSSARAATRTTASASSRASA